MKEAKSLPLLEDQNIEITGRVERVIWRSGENGFTVLRVIPDARQKAQGAAAAIPQDGFTCVGHMGAPKAGMHLALTGRWVKHARYGKQLAFTMADEILPATTDGIALYLSSGLIKGVGPKLAARIVERFGLDTIRVLDEEPELLLDVQGVGQKNFEHICRTWNEHRGIRDLMLFLQPHGISATYAVRIYNAYGARAREVVLQNPYRLAMDISGIGFLTADSIAEKLGFPKDHPTRIQAAILYLLQKASDDDGHVFLPLDILKKKTGELVHASGELMDRAMAQLEKDKRLVIEELPHGKDTDHIVAVYLSRFHHGESRIAFYLRRLASSPKSVLFKNREKIIADSVRNLSIQLAPAQLKAVEESTSSKILVITGGPGTGKTTIINAIIKVFEAAKGSVLLAAPTGRAAKRMSESTGHEAKTIHRLLEYSPKEDCFVRNEDNPLACGLLVVDETSMMDVLLFYYLLKALPLGATLVLVGDVHQLPSVGPGNVLGDIIDSGVAPVVELNEIFRQSARSDIILNAHRINRGISPILENEPGKASDFYFIQQEDGEDAARCIVDLIKYHIPRRFGLDAVNQIQLLTPMRKGDVGTERMNAMLQNALNPNAPEAARGDTKYRLHDKVMQIRNNYDKDIFNGDIGRIVYLDPREKILSVDFDGVRIPYKFDELDQLVPAYAISIHKSQGSEYPAVVIPIMMQHYIMLKRNLVYTGVTRGKRLVVLVGENRALQIAIRNNNTGKRYTRLASRLME